MTYQALLEAQVAAQAEVVYRYKYQAVGEGACSRKQPPKQQQDMRPEWKLLEMPRLRLA